MLLFVSLQIQTTFQLAFDILLVALIIYGSLSNPRSLDTPLRRILYRDGILFFLVSKKT